MKKLWLVLFGFIPLGIGWLINGLTMAYPNTVLPFGLISVAFLVLWAWLGFMSCKFEKASNKMNVASIPTRTLKQKESATERFGSLCYKTCKVAPIFLYADNYYIIRKSDSALAKKTYGISKNCKGEQNALYYS